jgi:peptidoglycan pentaglycine glycine transferase (the first glycine)
MPEVNLTEWNQFMESHPDAHLLQLGEWGELKQDFGWKPVRFILDCKTGAQILFRRLPLGLTLGYLPKPVFNGQWPAASNQFWKQVDFICKKNRAIFLKIEPDIWEDNFSDGQLTLNISRHNIQPPRTIILDIKSSEDTILSRMKPKCRYNIRLAEKKDVTIRAWDDISTFHEMLTVTGGRDNFGVHSKAYYQRAYDLFHANQACELLVAEYEGKPLAALMVFAHGKRAWYVYGASNDQERNRMPTYLLQWAAIRWAKARGCEEYDLWGVPDENEETLEADFENRHDSLWGVYRFKRGFGGQLRRAAQAIDKVYIPFLYNLYLWRMAGREVS